MSEKTTNEFVQESYRKGYLEGLAAAGRGEAYNRGFSDGQTSVRKDEVDDLRVRVTDLFREMSRLLDILGP